MKKARFHQLPSATARTGVQCGQDPGHRGLRGGVRAHRDRGEARPVAACYWRPICERPPPSGLGGNQHLVVRVAREGAHGPRPLPNSRPGPG